VKLKLSVRRAGDHPVDILATFDAGATVGDLARTLFVRDPKATGVATGQWTLEVLGTQRRSLAPDVAVADSGLLSGDTVSILPADPGPKAGMGKAAALLRVVEGPDAGKSFPLGLGTNVVGRGNGCDVKLTDSSVSREHAKVQISDVAEIVDMGSSNGLSVEGGDVARAMLRNSDQVRIGDTAFTVEVLEASAATLSATTVPFNRSPRLDPDYEPGETLLPDPPQRQQPHRFPLIALMAPLIMGAILVSVTNNKTTLIFLALSPIMAVGTFLESRVSNKKAYAKALVAWRAELQELGNDVRQALGEEQHRRLREHPSTEDVRAAVHERAPLLWTRRPAHSRFLEVRLGLGSRPARTVVKMPAQRQSEKALWNELEQFVAAFVNVEGVPVVGSLIDGAIGVSGPRESSLATARALVLQVVGLHSPAEVILAAVVAGDGHGSWDWLKWMPHTSSPHSPLVSQHLASNPSTVLALIAELEDLVDTRGVDHDGQNLPSVVVLVEDAAATERARLVSLAERGPDVGVHMVWVSPSLDRLPAACLAYVDVPIGGPLGVAGFLADGDSVSPVTVEVLGPEVEPLARAMAPLVDSGAPLDDDSDLPRTVSWMSLHDRAVASYPAAVIERWQESRSVMTGEYANPPRRGKPGSLRAVLGQSAGERHTLDLRSQGPHALVGGTTGSGKSELLQSWILGMAAAHSPERVTFLLVDYKGGSAFRECLLLPHTVGLVTDLSPHLVRRALTSLSAELKFREELLAHKRKKDLQELEESGDPDSPPSLVIVVDEFAALVQEVPEFVEGVVNVAQRGRSLGLHLILATQRPAGVIKDNLRANTNLRLALRVADEGDSQDVIGTGQAAAFDPALPGRAVSKTGPGRLVPFQAAYAGGWTTDAPTPPQIAVEELTLGSRVIWEEPETAEPEVQPELGPNDIARVVVTIQAASKIANLPDPRKPWLPELEEVYELGDLPTARRDDQLVFGTVDDPSNQMQPTVSFFPDRDGNLVVYGTGGSGKSGLLRTLAIASGFTFRGGPCRVYGLDFGARGLDMLEELPHVGSIIAGGDHERLTRLLTDLRALIDERAVRYARAKAGTITEYRGLANAPDESRIMLLVDGLAAFRTAYESSDKARWFEVFQSITTDGRPVGVHVVLSADRPAAVPSALGAAVQSRVVLRLADENDYTTLGEATDVLTTGSPAGRGIMGGAEVQVAILGGTRNTLEQARAIARLGEAMRRAGVPEAPPVRSLVEQVALTDLPATLYEAPVLGVGGPQLEALAVVPRGTFVVTGPPGSGRSTALASLVMAAQRWRPDAVLHYFGQKRSELAGLSAFASVSTTPEEVAAQAALLTSQLAGGVPSPLVVFLEGVGEFVNTPADMPLQALAKAVTAEDQWFIAEGEVSSWSSGMLPSLLRASRSGLALQPDPYDGTAVFKTEFPRLKRAELPPGRGLLVRGGKTTLIQVAQAGFVGSSPHSAMAT
jgi:S-DNA-T family DNA segregation ATPase FtsK/SpoIIIE